jgi:hypothetical protein
LWSLIGFSRPRKSVRVAAQLAARKVAKNWLSNSGFAGNAALNIAAMRMLQST